MKKLAPFWMLLIAAVAVSPLLSNCSSLHLGDDTAQRDPPAADGGQLVQSARGVSADHRIAPRDILQISVFQVQDLNSAVQVSEDGTVALPLVGKVQLSGQTTQEAEKTLTARYRKYLQSPQVSIAVQTYGTRMTISGEVRTPSVLPDDGKTTLSEAIANAGGLSDVANSSRIHIARLTNGQVQDEIYDLDDIQAGKTTDPLLRGGDIVVAESSKFKVAFKTATQLLQFGGVGSEAATAVK
jgi:polysaccharide export outer membrane protein